MNLETSKKILKIFGIIDIVVGILGILVGALAVAGGGMVADDEDVAAMALVAGIILLIGGIIGLLEGIFSVRAAKDSDKIMPAWIFAIVSLAFAAIGIFTNIGSGGSGIMSSIGSLAINALVFVAANTIKKSR